MRNWFDEKIRAADRSDLYQAVLCGDTNTITEELRKLLQTSISFHDFCENFYHGFTTGVLTGIDGYAVKSNREGGMGRSDLYLLPLDMNKTAFVVEFKMATSRNFVKHPNVKFK